MSSPDFYTSGGRTGLIVKHAVIPLLIGGLIYICWRTESLQMFRWFESLQLADGIGVLRSLCAPAAAVLPPWLLYSLPDALWLYALTVFMGALWADAATSDRYIFLALGPVLGIGSELGQFINLLPGTFDMIDLALLTGASLLAFFVVYMVYGRQFHAAGVNIPRH